MSSLAQPRGPLPARVYWIRRAVVLLIALVVVFTLAKLLGGGSDGRSDEGAQATTASGEQKPTSTTSSKAPSTPAPTTPAPAAAPAPSGQPLAEPKGACDPEDIVVRPVIGRSAGGQNVPFKLAVTGKEAACTWTFSQKSVALKITSGNDLIWSSQECRTLPTRDLVVRNNVPAHVDLVWNARRSDKKCTGKAAWALPGHYHVVVAAMGGEPADVQFELTRPPTVIVTQTPSPAPQPSTTPAPAPAPAPAPQPTTQPQG